MTPQAFLAPLATLEYWLLFAIVFAAFVVKRLTGFGNTLVINSCFGFLKEARFTSPVEMLWNIPANAWLVWQERRHLDLRLVLPICAFVGAGDLAGAWLLASGPDAALKVVLGILLVALGAEMLFNTARFKPRPAVAWGVGLVSGVVMGLFGIGAIIAAWFNKLSDSKEHYRSNLCFVFLADNAFRTAAYAATGLFTAEALAFSLLLFPAVGLGMAAGRFADRFLDARAIRLGTVVLLVVSGALLVVRYLSGG